MAVSAIYESVKNYLSSLYINVENEWLAGCISYLSENAEERYSIEDIKKLTREQWLLNDLNEICPGSLPANLKSYKKITLSDTYMVQINSVINIGASAYQQYLAMQKVNQENIIATSDSEEKIQNHRVLKFWLTDGAQELTAIEYKPMRNVSPTNIIPGCKALLKGPIECRRGVFFLTESNFELIGGEVEELVKLNSQASLLAAKLNLPVPEPVREPAMDPAVDSIRSSIANDPTKQNFTKTASTVDQQLLQSSRTVDSRLKTATDSHQTLSSRQRLLDHYLNKVESRQPVAESRQPVAESRQPVAESCQPVVESRQPVIESYHPVVESSKPVARVQCIQVLNHFSEEDLDVDLAAAFEAELIESLVVDEPEPEPPKLDSNKRPLLGQMRSQSNPEKKLKTVNRVEDYPTDEDLCCFGDFVTKSVKSKVKEVKFPIKISAEPFTYIKIINELPPHERTGKVFKVKGQIMKLLSKLAVGREGWSLSCAIIDGTGSLDVEFTSDVLSKLVGYTPQQMNELKKRMGTNPEIKEMALNALQKAKNSLQVLYCIIELTFKPGIPQPQITQLIPFNESHYKSLEKRNANLHQYSNRRPDLHGGIEDLDIQIFSDV